MSSLRYFQRQHYWVGAFTAMACPCEVIVEADQATAQQAIETVAAEAWRIERQYSRYRDDNIVAQIHAAQGQPVEVNAETARLLDFAEQLYDLSGGLFDITAGVLRTLWDFKQQHIPTQAAIDQLLPYIGWSRLTWQSPWLTLPVGMQIDFGGLGKEYAVDRCAQLVAAHPALINFGGDLAVTRAPAAGQWSVAIEGAPAYVALKQGGLATSGGTQRYIHYQGRRYSHILNPTTGWPVVDAPLSVSVLADNCTQAGMLATMAMLQGDQAEEFLTTQQVQYWCQW